MPESLIQTAAPYGEIADIKPHPLADLFPLMDGSEYQALVEDIRVRGLISPIVMLDDMILDGRNRYRACIDAGVPIRTENFTGNDPLGWVISANLHRRHLNESQRAMIGAKLATLPVGANQHAPIGVPSQEQAADLLSVARRSIQRAAVVRDHAVPELAGKVERGELAVSVAAKAAKLPAEKQREIAGLPEKRAKHRIKQISRAEKEAALAERTKAESEKLGTKLYGLILADPPWRLEPWSRETGMDRAADNHFQTMTFEEIEQRKPPAAKNCILFLWTTVPMAHLAHKLLDVWGFEYRTQLSWVKDRAGHGYWFLNRHEILLVAVKGDVPAPAPGEQFESVIKAAAKRHSEKPTKSYEIIEEMFPTLPKLEMYARSGREGWDSWGNEAPCSPDTESEVAA
jgi:N6-adenosine-specific RNA methylase IME4